MLSYVYLMLYVFFFKQKTAYEMRISDWSSDVCSSDLGIGLKEIGGLAVAVGRHLFQDLVRIIQRRRHEIGGFVAGIAEHDALVARAFILVSAGVNALRDMRGLTVEEVGEFGGFPMETLLLISNAFDRIPGRFFDFGLACRCQFTIFGNEAAIRAAHFPRQHDPVGGGERFAGDTRFGVLGKEQVDDGVADLI